MFDPAEPNTKREIHLTYTTDANGKVAIAIDSDGFEDNPEFVAFFLLNTVKVIASLTEDEPE